MNVLQTQQESTNTPHLVRPAGAPGRGELNHAPVSLAARTCQFILGERRNHDAGADRVDPRAALAPAHGLGHRAERVSAFGDLAGVERVGRLVRLEHRQSKQLVGRRRRQRLVLAGRRALGVVASRWILQLCRSFVCIVCHWFCFR